MSSIEEFVEAYKKLPFNYMLLEIHNDNEAFYIEEDTLYWLEGGESYSGYITEGVQRYSGWLCVNLDSQAGTWITHMFKESNESVIPLEEED